LLSSFELIHCLGFCKNNSNLRLRFITHTHTHIRYRMCSLHMICVHSVSGKCF
jgi:hypothetical protein